ncbi:APC family permease [Streptomyces sp. NPDC093591]|uniref:APC family permease n=1 Tax=Streptomyces sp. NPDC093591 TaxID=3366044 RepID=UPI0038142895
MTEPLTSNSGDGSVPLADELDRGRLGRPQLVSLAVASFIPAVGMSTAPLLFFQNGGFIAWPAAMLSMIAVIAVGLSVSVFARRYVATGSLYSYVGKVFGPWAQVIVAAALLLGFVMQLGGTSNIVGIYLGSFLTTLGVQNAFGFGMQALILGLTLVIVGLIAARGLDTSLWVIVGATIVTVPVVAFITIDSATTTGLHLGEQLRLADLPVSSVFQGMAAGIAFLVGFESCTALAAETRDPKRNVPLALMSVPVVLGVLYLVATFLQVPGMAATADALAAGASPASALAGLAGLPSWFSGAADLILAIATFAALVAFANYGSRYLATLGVDRMMPAWVKSMSRRQTPVAAIVTLLVLAYLFLMGTYAAAGDFLSSYSAVAVAIVYCWVPMYLLITAGALVLMARDRVFSPVAAIGSVVGFLAMAYLYVNGVINPPAPPADDMTWVVPLGILVLVAAFAVARRRVSATGADEGRATATGEDATPLAGGTRKPGTGGT